MAIAGVDHDVWRESVGRGAWREAPPTEGGRHRSFDPDDLIALVLFRELMAIGITRANAAAISSDVRAALRESPDLQTLSVVKDADSHGKPRAAVVVTPPPGALVLMAFSIAKMRAGIEADLAGAAP